MTLKNKNNNDLIINADFYIKASLSTREHIHLLKKKGKNDKPEYFLGLNSLNKMFVFSVDPIFFERMSNVIYSETGKTHSRIDVDFLDEVLKKSATNLNQKNVEPTWVNLNTSEGATSGILIFGDDITGTALVVEISKENNIAENLKIRVAFKNLSHQGDVPIYRAQIGEFKYFPVSKNKAKEELASLISEQGIEFDDADLKIFNTANFIKNSVEKIRKTFKM